MALFIGLETVYPPLPKELFISNGSQPELSIRFASFEVDLHSCELRKDGVRVHLHDQPFQVLAILLEHRGELVTREELRQALWQTGTFVDFENGLNSAINRLREALCDSAKTPKYIETVPRRGYRFIAPIDRPAKVSNSDPTSLPVDPPPRPQLLSHRRWLILGTGTLVLLAMIPLVAWHRLPESSVGVISRQLSPIPLVTFAGGSQWMPAFSPEGSRVAYVWETETGSNYLEVKQLGSDTRLRLTHKPAELPLAPAWSPDGQWIAFARTGPDDDRGIFVIPALGGRERKLRSLATWYVPQRIVSWSPDGRWIVFADEIRPSSSALSKIRRANAIYLISPETLETRQLTHPEPGDFGDSAPTFSPDGATIAFVRTKANSRDEIYTVPTQGGTPYKLVTDGIWTNGLTWTSDGKSIIFDRSFVGGFRLWRVSLQGGALHSLDLPISHANLMEPNVRHGRLAYESHESIQTVGRVELNRLHSELPIKLVASTQSEWDGRYSPDGEHIAFISNRTGFDELWMADSDGTNPVQLTHLRTPLGGLSWQPAGALIAVSTDSGQVFVVSHETQPA